MSREMPVRELQSFEKKTQAWVKEGKKWGLYEVVDVSGGSVVLKAGRHSTILVPLEQMAKYQEEKLKEFWRDWVQEFGSDDRKQLWIKHQGIWMRATLCDQRLRDDSPRSVKVLTDVGKMELIVTPEELLKWSHDQSRPTEADFAGEEEAEA